MTQLIKLDVKTELPVITGNFDELKAVAEQELEKYKGHVVTVDSVKQDKKLMAELNKVVKQIDDTRKEYKQKLGAPVVEFEEKMKELSKMYSDVRSEIKAQTDKFEQEQKDKAETLIEEFLQSMYEDNDVREPFQKAKVDNLVTLGALTAKGQLTKKTKDAITGEVNRCLAWQAKIDGRLSDLENQCYKAGLSEPLQHHHVQGFLFNENDEAYNQQVQDLISAEVERNQKIQEAAKAKAEQEAAEKARLEQQAKLAEQAQPDPEVQNQSQVGQHFAETSRIDIIGQNGNSGEHYEQTGYAGVDAHVEQEYQQQHHQDFTQERDEQYIQHYQQEQMAQVESAPVQSGRVQVLVNCLFTIELPVSITDEQIERKFRQQLQQAGFTSLDSIGIVRK